MMFDRNKMNAEINSMKLFLKCSHTRLCYPRPKRENFTYSSNIQVSYQWSTTMHPKVNPWIIKRPKCSEAALVYEIPTQISCFGWSLSFLYFSFIRRPKRTPNQLITCITKIYNWQRILRITRRTVLFKYQTKNKKTKTIERTSCRCHVLLIIRGRGGDPLSLSVAAAALPSAD